MANYKLTNDYWETSGIYDIGQGKTQREINNALVDAVETESVTDNVPYVFRKSGGDKTVGKREMDKLVGGTIVWNQLASSDRDYTLNRSTQRTVGMQTGGIYPQLNHIYLATVNILSDSTTLGFLFQYGNSLGFGQGTGIKSIIYKANSSSVNYIYGFISSDEGSSAELSYKDFSIFDLTQMFGSTIADAVYAMETATAGAGVAWFKNLFPNTDYAYDAGSLQSVNTSAHVTTGFNQWDEQWEVGGWNADGTSSGSSDRIRCKNFIPITPDTAYYFKSGSNDGIFFYIWYDDNKVNIGNVTQATESRIITSPSNAHYMLFFMAAAYGLSYKNDICINISSTKNGTYEPYTKRTYPLDSTLTLRGVPKLDSGNNLYYDGDTYESSGMVTRKYGILDLGSVNYGTLAANTYYVALGTLALPSKNPPSVICQKYSYSTSTYNSLGDKEYTTNGSGIGGAAYVTFKDTDYANNSAFKTAMSGVYLVYELATPTTETASPYTNPQVVDQSGTEEYVDAAVAASSRDVSVPVGHETEYMTEAASKSAGWETDYSTMIAPTETGYVATKAYSENDIFIVSNQLYIATDSISIGDAIVVGTNVDAVNIAELITELLNG